MKRSFLIGCAVLWLTALSLAATDVGRGPVRSPLDLARPNVQNYVTRTGNVWMNITNAGYFGNDGPSQTSALHDPCPPFGWAPQCEFPGGSGQEYLFEAALWVGALVVDSGVETPRVSVGIDGWLNPAIMEFWPAEGTAGELVHRSNLTGATDCLGNPIYDSQAGANDEFIATYSDTLVDPSYTVPDPIDGPHRPLGIQVQQVSRSWQSNDFGDFVLFDYRIRNIGTNLLKNVYVGLYVDADVGLVTEMYHHTDDICGFLANDVSYGGGDTVITPLNIAWIADNDGRPAGVISGPLVCPHVVGTYVLVPPGQRSKFSFNWWISNGDVALDYGPSWSSYADHDSLSMGWTRLYGTPMGDAHKYQVMSNGEIDFWQIMVNRMQDVPPQIYTDPFTQQTHVEPWCTSDPSPNAADIANGYDTRYLLSWGPLGTFDHNEPNGEPVYLLNPGQDITLSFAHVLGRDFHDANHPQPTDQTIDSSLFSFAGLKHTARAARFLFDNAATHQPPIPPAGYGSLATSSGRVDLVWLSSRFAHVRGYNVFGKNMAQPDSLYRLNTTLVTDTFFSVTSGLQNGQDWLFRLQTVDDSGWTSSYLDTLIRVAAPFPVRDLSGEVSGNAVWLHWTANTESNLTGYTVIRTDTLTDSVRTYPSQRARFEDVNASPGREYCYQVVAKNSLGLQSLVSGSVLGRPLAPAHRILVIDETLNATTIQRAQLGGIADSLVDSTYSQILRQLNEPYDRIVQTAFDSAQFTLEQLAGYDVVIWHSEDNNPARSYSLVQQRETIFGSYVNLGGKLLRFARQFGHGKLLASGWLLNSTLPPLSYMLPLHFLGYYASPSFATTPLDSTMLQFVGANPEATGWPIVHIDTARVNALHWRGHSYPYLPEIDQMLLWPNSPTSALYRSVDAAGDTARGNQPCAVAGNGEILCAFPLYFLQPADATALVQQALTTLRQWDTSPLELSLGVVQNPVQTSDLDLYLVSNKPLNTPLPYIFITSTSTRDSVLLEQAYGNVYHADWRLGANDLFTLSVSTLDGAGRTATATHTFRSHYVIPGGPGLLLTLPGDATTLSLPDAAFSTSGHILFHTTTEDMQVESSSSLSSQVVIGPATWALNRPAQLTIRCDVSPAALQRGVHVSRLDQGKWVALRGETHITGNSVSVDIMQLGTYAVFEGSADLLPLTTRLYPGYPNPFNPSTTIRFDLAKSGNVKLMVFNILGEQVRTLINNSMNAGEHQVRWDGADAKGHTLSSGVYIVRLETAQSNLAVKLAMIR